MSPRARCPHKRLSLNTVSDGDLTNGRGPIYTCCHHQTDTSEGRDAALERLSVSLVWHTILEFIGCRLYTADSRRCLIAFFIPSAASYANFVNAGLGDFDIRSLAAVLAVGLPASRSIGVRLSGSLGVAADLHLEIGKHLSTTDDPDFCSFCCRALFGLHRL